MSAAPASKRSLVGLAAVVLAVYGGTAWWRDRQADLLGPEIARLARAGDIQMLSSTTCVYCTRARQWFTAQQVPFTECFIERDTACAARYQALGGRGTPTLLVRGQVQLGFSAPQVRDGLSAAPARAGG
jgi:glutaredoxin